MIKNVLLSLLGKCLEDYYSMELIDAYNFFKCHDSFELFYLANRHVLSGRFLL